MLLFESPLGKTTTYSQHYDPSLLYPIPRTLAREAIGLKDPLPFQGADLWTAYELSWLSKKGQPLLAIADILVPLTTPQIAESKSVKLYLNSYSQTAFASPQEVQEKIEKDLSSCSGGPVKVRLILQEDFPKEQIESWNGICLDHLDIDYHDYQRSPKILENSAHSHGSHVQETLYTYLFKSHCLVTGQPDWAGIKISYEGPRIDPKAVSRYLVSYRLHSGIAEQCVEQIFMDIWQACTPKNLTVYGRFTRRGGIDINPFRTNYQDIPKNLRLAFQ